MKITNKNIKNIIKDLIDEYGNDIDLNHLDVSNVTDMSCMFAYCTKFNGDISSWNIRNDTNMNYMFVYDNFKNVDILKEYFNDSIPKGKIIDILKDKYPENFI